MPPDASRHLLTVHAGNSIQDSQRLFDRTAKFKGIESSLLCLTSPDTTLATMCRADRHRINLWFRSSCHGRTSCMVTTESPYSPGDCGFPRQLAGIDLPRCLYALVQAQLTNTLFLSICTGCIPLPFALLSSDSPHFTPWFASHTQESNFHSSSAAPSTG